MATPEQCLALEHGREVVRIGGYVLPAEDFSMAAFMRNDLGMSWLHPGGIISTERLLMMLDVKPGMLVLDMGSGLGSTARYLATRFGCQVIGIDQDPSMVEEAMRRTMAPQYKNVAFEQMDALHTRFPENYFDMVIIQSVACFNDKTSLFSEVRRVLKPGGQLGINESTWIKSPTDKVKRVTRSTVCQTFKNALLAEDWVSELSAAGLVAVESRTHEFTSMSPYQMLREEGFLKTLSILWTVLRKPDLNMRLSAVSSYFTNFPGYFGYGLYTAKKPT
ncbi:MAG: methyltransferase domain-containing protein [Gammaproteobacteria bacterium]|nr:methyltransferase domain-containing protein [Gammaproteobacteria bacterium]